MKRVSTARAKQMRQYRKLKIGFLDTHDTCFVCGKRLLPVMRDLHHLAGRVGRLLCFEPLWRCVCGPCHTWIHNNPQVSRDWGNLAPEGCWNDFRRAVAWHNQKDTK